MVEEWAVWADVALEDAQAFEAILAESWPQWNNVPREEEDVD